MSFDGHVLCQRIAIGPCAFAIIGKPSVAPAAATPVAPLRNLRRVGVIEAAAGVAAACGLRIMIPPKSGRSRRASGLLRPGARSNGGRWTALFALAVESTRDYTQGRHRVHTRGCARPRRCV